MTALTETDYAALDTTTPLELPDGRSLTVEVVPDPDTSINDYDCYGRLECVHDPYGISSRQHGNRPADFNGNAEIVNRERSDTLWWQPPAAVKRGTDAFDRLRSIVVDLVTYGFVGVVVTLRCEHGGEIDSESLFGIDSPFDDAYLHQVACELATALLESNDQKGCHQ